MKQAIPFSRLAETVKVVKTVLFLSPHMSAFLVCRPATGSPLTAQIVILHTARCLLRVARFTTIKPGI